MDECMTTGAMKSQECPTDRMTAEELGCAGVCANGRQRDGIKRDRKRPIIAFCFTAEKRERLRVR